MTRDNSSRFSLEARKEGIAMKNLLRWLQGSERPPVQHERAEPLFAPETRLERVGFPGLAALGLLCQLLIFWLLSFPYTYFERGICEVDCISTCSCLPSSPVA